MDSKAPKKLDKKPSKTNLSLQKRQKEDNVKRKLKKLISSKNAEISLNDSSEFQFTSKHAIQSKQTSDVAKANRPKETEADIPKVRREVKKASEPVQEQELKRCGEPVNEIIEPAGKKSHGCIEKAKEVEIKEQGKSIKSLRSEDCQGIQLDEDYSLCTVCNQKFSVSQIQAHQIQCLKERFQAKKSTGKERERTLEDKEENEFVESNSEDAVLCQFCNKDLTKLNSLLKNQHVSNCMDKVELQQQKVNKGKPTGNSALGAFDCPFCGKVLKTERARKIHAKRCSQNHGIPPEDGLTLTNAQAEGHGKTTSKKMPSKFDEDLQMAIAMSKSMKETDSIDPIKLNVPVTKKGKQASRKGKKQLEGKGSEPVLLLLQEDEKQKRLSLKVAAMLLPQEFGSENDSDDDTPCDDRIVKIMSTRSDGMDTEIDTQIKSFWTRSALDEGQTSCSQKKGLFYVENLMPPITVSQVDLVSKMDKKRKMSCDQGISPSEERTSCQSTYLSPADDNLSVGDVITASTQTAVNLALLETEDLDEPDCLVTDINCSGFCPEKNIDVPEDIAKSVSLTLREDLSRLIDNSDHSDIQIVCENKTINAHRVILAIRCPSFLQRITEDPASLKDKTYDVILSVLKFIYAGEISLTKSSLVDVRIVAERMGIKELKEICQALEKNETKCTRTTENNSFEDNVEIESSPSSDSVRTTGNASFQSNIDIHLLPSSDSEMDIIPTEENAIGNVNRTDSDVHNLSKADSETERLQLSENKNISVHNHDGKIHSPLMSDSETDIHMCESETDILGKDDRKMNISVGSYGKESEVKGCDIQSSYEHGSDLEIDDAVLVELKPKSKESVENKEHTEEFFVDIDNGVKNRSLDRQQRREEMMECDDVESDFSTSDNKLITEEPLDQASTEERHSESGQREYTEMSDLAFGEDSFWTPSDLSVEDAMNRTFDDNQNQQVDREESPYRTEMRSLRVDENSIEIHKKEIKEVSEHSFTGCDGYQEKSIIDYSPSKSENESEEIGMSFQQQYIGDGSNLNDSFNVSSPPFKMDTPKRDSPDVPKLSFEKKRQKDKADKHKKQESSKTAASSPCRSPKQKVKNTCQFTKLPSEEKMNSPVMEEFSKTPKSNTYMKQGDCRKNFTIPSPFTPMPTYDKMNTPALKREMQRFGVKPVGKKRMIMLLKDIYQKTHEYETDSEFEVSKNDLEDIPNFDDFDDFPADNDLSIPNGDDLDDIPACDDLDLVICDSDVEDDVCTASQESDRSDLIEESYFEMGNLTPTSSPTKASGADLPQKFRQFINDNEDIHNKVLLCEPLELDLLKKQMTEKGIKCSMEKLMDFLDEMCITFTMKNNRKREKRKKKTSSK